jgi:hypothetical protein
VFQTATKQQTPDEREKQHFATKVDLKNRTLKYIA